MNQENLGESEIWRRVLLMSGGERTAVTQPLEAYEQLQEDLHDLTMVAERRTESTTTLEEQKKAALNLYYHDNSPPQGSAEYLYPFRYTLVYGRRSDHHQNYSRCETKT